MKSDINSYKEASSDAIGFLLHFLVLICGFLCSTANILNGLMPFGIAFVSSSPRKYITSAVFGSAIGYLLFITKGGFAYIAALFAVAVIKIILGNAGRITKAAFFPAILSFLSLLVTGIIVGLSYGENLALQLGQALLSGGAAYFFAIIFSIDPTLSDGLDIRESVAVMLFTGVLLLSLYRFDAFGINPGRIFAVLFILTAARYGKASYGAVAGTVIGFTLALFDGNLYTVSAIFAFCGLMSGLFSRLGSLGMVGSYLTTSLVSILMMGKEDMLAVIFFESLIGGGLFLLIPQKLSSFLIGVLSPRAEIARPDTLKGALIMRLEFASGALKDIFETVEEVSTQLKKINTPDFERTLNEVEHEVCGGCSLRKHCWETAKEITAEDTLRLWGRIKSGSTPEEVPLSMNCLRPTNFESSVKQHCAEYESRRIADQRISEVRGVISDQFSAISDMLGDLCEEFKYEIRHDAKSAENIVLTMKNLGFHTVGCVTAKDKYGRLSADIHIKGVADHTINKMELVKALSLACNKDFDTPSVSLGGDEAFISITERPIYQIEIGISQIPEKQGKLCGDSYKYFCDGRGKFIIVLSDGMGTGGRAAVDSAMVSGLMGRMLCSGFGYDCSLKIINSSMLFKSTDESLATVDIATIDLFTGECELRKAGAAPTLVRKNGKVGKAQSNSLPPGILRDVAFDRAVVNLKAEDIVVMVSDGATTEGTDWISEKLSEWTIGSAQQLADEIAFAARRRRSDGHSDDITVVTAILKQKL